MSAVAHLRVIGVSGSRLRWLILFLFTALLFVFVCPLLGFRLTLSFDAANTWESIAGLSSYPFSLLLLLAACTAFRSILYIDIPSSGDPPFCPPHYQIPFCQCGHLFRGHAIPGLSVEGSPLNVVLFTFGAAHIRPCCTFLRGLYRYPTCLVNHQARYLSRHVLQLPLFSSLHVSRTSSLCSLYPKGSTWDTFPFPVMSSLTSLSLHYTTFGKTGPDVLGAVVFLAFVARTFFFFFFWLAYTVTGYPIS